MSRNHKYFERKPETWNIIDFLNECEVEPYDLKIDTQKASLMTSKEGELEKRNRFSTDLCWQVKILLVVA
jgi:hypothetical protein